MKENTIINHVALNYKDKEKADIFFTKILGLDLKKTFTLSAEKSKEIFEIGKEISAFSYENENTRFEIFITDDLKPTLFEHTCIIIKNKEDFIARCKNYGLKPNLVKRGEKTYLFVRDFSNNLFEVKEKT
jgi:catechol 2,3-dioxygenase-like lactoylglutathione lyase family enzyme